MGIMKKRQDEELDNLEKVYKLKKQQAILETKANLNKKFEENRKELENKKLGNIKLLDELESLQKQKQMHLQAEISKIETSIDLELAKEKISLNNKHYLEFNEALKEFANIEDQQETDANMKDLEIELAKESAERLAKLEQEKLEYERSEEARVKLELENFEKELKSEAEFEQNKTDL